MAIQPTKVYAQNAIERNKLKLKKRLKYRLHQYKLLNLKIQKKKRKSLLRRITSVVFSATDDSGLCHFYVGVSIVFVVNTGCHQIMTVSMTIELKGEENLVKAIL